MSDGASDWEVKACDDLAELDLQLVSSFFNQYFPGVFYPECSPKIFQWKLGRGNPAGCGFLTVALHDGKVIGTTSATRQNVLKGGELVNVIEIGDTFTHPDFRRNGNCLSLYPGTASSDDYLNKSVFGRLVTETLDRARASGILYVFGTPNENSRPPYINRLGFKEIGWGKVKSWSLPTGHFKTGSKKDLVVAPAIMLVKAVQKINILMCARHVEVDENGFESFVQERETALWSDSKDRSENDSIRMDQSSTFFKYRYASHPNHRYRYFKIRVHNRTVGWIICVVLVRQSGRETLVVSDWIFADRASEKNLPKYSAIIGSKFKSAQLVSLWSENSEYSTLRWGQFGFFSRNSVSIITKTLTADEGQGIQEFADFRIGWSDNG